MASKENVKAILNSGITDTSEMKKILKNNEGNIEDALAYYTLSKKCNDNIFTDDEKFKKFIKDQKLDPQIAATIRDNMRKFR